MQPLRKKYGPSTLDPALTNAILQEIEARLSQGLLPVHNGHLQEFSQGGDVMEYLLFMKKEGLISGDVVSKGANSTPYRMTNIRLTYAGIRMRRT